MLEGEGALVKSCVLAADDFETLSAPGFDAVVLVHEDAPGVFAPLVQALAADARTRELPLVAVAGPRVSLAALGALAGVAFVPSTPGAAALIALLERLLAPNRAAREATMSLGVARDRLRKLGGIVATTREETSRLSHDALALVGIVVGYGANLRDAIPGPLTPAQRTHVARMLEAASDVAELVQQHAALVREAAEPASDDEPLSVRRPGDRRGLHDVAELARATTALFQQAAAQKRIDLGFAAPAVAEIWCDALQMKQVVTNLLVNALKLTPEGGRVHVGVHPRAPSGGETGIAARAMVELVVADAGPGVPEPERARIFERGVRLARDRHLAGSGIGLAVVKDVVAAHGGEVHVESAAGLGGAAFVVRLPVDRRQRRADA
jgi:signal transduction histidine kinase